MSKVPELVNEICPSCNPQSYNKTKARFMGEVEDCEISSRIPLPVCGARLWVTEQWAKENEVKNNDE